MRSNNLINFQPQPNFPAEDIDASNADMASYYLQTSPEANAYLKTYQQTLQGMHSIGNAALRYADTNPGNNSGEYQAFCRGFTTIDYTATLLNARPFKQLASGTGMGYFYLRHQGFEDVELAKRIKTWRSSHENTLDLMLTLSDLRGETPKQFTARLIGAQVASELLVTR